MTPVSPPTEHPSPEFMRAVGQALKLSYDKPGDDPPAAVPVDNGQAHGA